MMINLLDSDWLLNMLEKSGNTPRERILALFDVLQNWLDAPLIANNFHFANPAHPKLQTYLADQAVQIGAQAPQLLASQICLMAVAALQAHMHNPASGSLAHARQAAQALITAQTITKPARHAWQYVASLAAVLTMGVAILHFNRFNFSGITWESPAIASAEQAPAASFAESAAANPTQTAALMAEIERMRHGNCQLIEAIQLPEAYKQVYFDNIISGQISTNPQEQKMVYELLRMVRCNYTPMLMANSTG